MIIIPKVIETQAKPFLFIFQFYFNFGGKIGLKDSKNSFDNIYHIMSSTKMPLSLRI